MLLDLLAAGIGPLIVWLAIAIAPPLVRMLAEGAGRLVEGRGADEQDVPPVSVPPPSAPVVAGPPRVPGGPLALRRNRTHGRDRANHGRD